MSQQRQIEGVVEKPEGGNTYHSNSATLVTLCSQDIERLLHKFHSSYAHDFKNPQTCTPAPILKQILKQILKEILKQILKYPFLLILLD